MKKICIFMLITFCFCMSLLFAGCAGQSCIEVGGEWKDATGKISYCFNAPQSKANMIPTFESSSEGTLYGLSNEQVEKINALLENQEPGNKVEAKSAEKGITRLLSRLK